MSLSGISSRQCASGGWNRGLQRALLLSASAIVMLCMGCQTIQRDNGARLIAHPQFPAMKAAAPEATLLALDIIAELEAELESK